MKSSWSVIAEIGGAGVVGDVERVTALADLLASRLERDGDEHATWIRRAITPLRQRPLFRWQVRRREPTTATDHQKGMSDAA